MVYALFGFFWPPMHLRPVVAAGGGTLTDTLHIVWTTRFRAYSITTMVLLFGFGWLTGTYAPAMQANLPTPWVGVWERIDIGLFMAWVVVLSATLLRRPCAAAALTRQRDTLAA